MEKAFVNESECIGCGTCESVCPAGAIKVRENGKSQCDRDLCTSCQACVGVCPVGCISMK